MAVVVLVPKRLLTAVPLLSMVKLPPGFTVMPVPDGTVPAPLRSTVPLLTVIVPVRVLAAVKLRMLPAPVIDICKLKVPVPLLPTLLRSTVCPLPAKVSVEAAVVVRPPDRVSVAASRRGCRSASGWRPG